LDGSDAQLYISCISEYVCLFSCGYDMIWRKFNERFGFLDAQVCMSLYVCMCMFVCLCMCQDMGKHTWLYIFLCARASIFVYIYECVSIVCVFDCLFEYVCACVFWYVFLRV
jgi:hypothetical protein